MTIQIGGYTRRTKTGKMVQVKPYNAGRNARKAEEAKRKRQAPKPSPEAIQQREKLIKDAKRVAIRIAELNGKSPDTANNLRKQLESIVSRVKQINVDHGGALLPSEESSGVAKRAGDIGTLPSGAKLDASFLNNKPMSPQDHAHAAMVHGQLQNVALKAGRDDDFFFHQLQETAHRVEAIRGGSSLPAVMKQAPQQKKPKPPTQKSDISSSALMASFIANAGTDPAMRHAIAAAASMSPNLAGHLRNILRADARKKASIKALEHVARAEQANKQVAGLDFRDVSEPASNLIRNAANMRYPQRSLISDMRSRVHDSTLMSTAIAAAMSSGISKAAKDRFMKAASSAYSSRVNIPPPTDSGHYLYGLNSSINDAPKGWSTHNDHGQYLYGVAGYRKPLSEASVAKHNLTPLSPNGHKSTALRDAASELGGNASFMDTWGSMTTVERSATVNKIAKSANESQVTIQRELHEMILGDSVSSLWSH